MVILRVMQSMLKLSWVIRESKRPLLKLKFLIDPSFGISANWLAFGVCSWFPQELLLIKTRARALMRIAG